MLREVRTVMVMCLCLVVASTASGEFIGLNFVGLDAPLGTISPTDTAGVVPQANWNNATGASSAAPFALVDASGAPTGATATWIAPEVYTLLGVSPTPPIEGDDNMYYGSLYGTTPDYPDQPSATVDFAGLPSAVYDVYVYFDTTGRGTSSDHTVNGVTVADQHETGWFGTAGREFHQGGGAGVPGNYLVFSNVTGPTISVTMEANNLRMNLNGIQLVTHCAIGDADCDGDVDIADDIITAFSNFTGPGSFGKLRIEGDVQGDATGGTTNPAGHDQDVDVSDLLTMFGNFTGPLDEGGPVASDAGDPTIPDLIYDPATGEVVLDADGSGIIGYSLKSAGAFLPGGHTPILGGVATSLANELAEAALSSSDGSIGLVFPTGLDLAGLSAMLTTNEVSRGLGDPTVPFDLVVLGGSPAVPEPATIAMAFMGLAGLGLVIYRRRRAA